MKLLLPIVGFLLIQCSSFQRENERHPKYSATVDIFLDDMQDKYETNYKDSIKWEDLMGFSSSLKGVKMDDFEFVSVHNEEINMGSINKPIFLKATASWCAPCVTAIPALNDLAATYDGRVEFILITHDTYDKALEFSKKFDKRIKIVPSTATINALEPVKLKSGEFKSLLPFPTSYCIDEENYIREVITGGLRVGSFTSSGETITTTYEDAYNYNMQKFGGEIEKLLEKK